MSKENTYSVLRNPIAQGLLVLGASVSASLLIYKYVCTNDQSSSSYDSLIPFTVKQNKKQVNNEHEFSTILYERIPKQMQLQRSRDFLQFMNMRRSFRHFSDEPVDIEVIRNCVAAANTAPSGAHTSPWVFVLVTNRKKRIKIRKMVEAEEQINYDRRMKQAWIDKLQPVISNLHSFDAIQKEYLTKAPYLVVIMKEMYKIDEETGEKVENYYPNQSTGIAAGMFITALHNANLVTLPSTPMGAEKSIREICGRKQNEKVFLLCPIGYPAKDATIPYRTKGNLRKNMNKAMIIV
eukprot:276422_1